MWDKICYLISYPILCYIQSTKHSLEIILLCKKKGRNGKIIAHPYLQSGEPTTNYFIMEIKNVVSYLDRYFRKTYMT